jgi:hypothetical protein
MADLVLECVREGRPGRLHTEEQFEQVAARLRPTNIAPRPTHAIEAQGLRGAVVTPSEEGVRVAEGGVLLGGVIGEPGRWSDIGSQPPDGTFVLVRYSHASVELLCDVTSSRTLWYAHNEDRLIVSTSQRAVVMLLGDFELDRGAVSWLLTSNTLGPDCSWDARVRRLPPDSRLVLDRATWQAALELRPAVFAPVARSSEEHLGLLREALAWSCGALDIDTDHWLLPLSGGVDSRIILALMVKSGKRPRCITWTTRESLRNPLSDAFIARRVARRFGVEHTYAFLESGQKIDGAALQRFVELGEGGSSEFGGYVDGCAMWGDLFASGVSGVIRGDSPLGATKRSASLEAARQSDAPVVADFPEGHLLRGLGLADQVWPERLRPQPGEGLEPYADRMEQEVYISTGLAPLTGLKCRYLEVANPLLSRRVVALTRTLSDEVRMYGRAFSTIVDRECRHLPHARFGSTPDSSAYLTDEGIIGAVVAELASPAIASVLSEEAALTLLAALASPSHSPATVRGAAVAAMRKVQFAVPSRVAYRLAPRYKRADPVDAMDVAFRATIASKTVALLDRDAGALGQARA